MKTVTLNKTQTALIAKQIEEAEIKAIELAGEHPWVAVGYYKGTLDLIKKQLTGIYPVV